MPKGLIRKLGVFGEVLKKVIYNGIGIRIVDVHKVPKVMLLIVGLWFLKVRMVMGQAHRVTLQKH